MRGIGDTLSSVGTQYDFTKLTNAQLEAAAKKLGSEGKISYQDALQLSFVAEGMDRTPIDRSKVVSVAQTLADPTKKLDCLFSTELRLAALYRGKGSRDNRLNSQGSPGVSKPLNRGVKQNILLAGLGALS